MDDEPRIQDRKSILSIVAFGLRFRVSDLKWRRHNDDAVVAHAAEQLLAHLEQSNVRMKIGPPLRPHCGPGDELGYALTGKPFSTRPAWTAVVRGARR